MSFKTLEELNILEKKIPRSDVRSRAKIAKLKLAVLESCNCGRRHFSELKIKRELTEYEQTTNFVKLNESFDEEEQTLENELVEILNKDIKAYAVKADKQSDLFQLLFLGIISYVALKKILTLSANRSYEQGRKSAMPYFKGNMPTKPNETTKLINLQAENQANMIGGELSSQASAFILAAIAAGVAKKDIVAALPGLLREEASRLITNTTGLIPAANIGRGRTDVFKMFTTQIVGYQRSEILDSKTCNLCLSWDKRIVKPDSEYTKIDAFHNNCRGLWIPIVDSAPKPEFKPLPKTITEAFNKVGGVPIINSFKQIKKPVNKVNVEVRQEIERRLKT